MESLLHKLIEIDACVNVTWTLYAASLEFIYLFVNRKQLSKCYISSLCPCCQKVDTLGIVHCNQSRPFWISWEGGRIKLGSGARVGRNTILDYMHDDPYDVTMATLSTGFGSKGIWVISQPEGRNIEASSLLKL